MKRFLSFLLILTLLAACLSVAVLADATVQTSDPNAALEGFLALPDWPVDEDETSERKGETIYPDEFAGMYVAEDGTLVVCVTEDTPQIEQYYQDMLPNIPSLRFQTVKYDYNTLQHFMLVIEQRHVSSNLLVVNMYKIKDYHINYEFNRIDIKMYSDQEYNSVLYLDGIFGDAIFIYFCDTTGEIDWYDQEYVKQRQVELDAQAEEDAANAETTTLADEISAQAEETGFNFQSVALPIILVVVIIVVFFVISKLRSRKTQFDDDYIDK